ncbi:MAG: hypothetical protein IPG09_15890 [Ignavibacteria bacterium]|nr:hypothetical protein [Ignavibacteria bacterium]
MNHSTLLRKQPVIQAAAEAKADFLYRWGRPSNYRGSAHKCLMLFIDVTGYLTVCPAEEHYGFQ